MNAATAVDPAAVAGWPDADLTAELRRVQREVARLEAWRAELIGEAERRDLLEADLVRLLELLGTIHRSEESADWVAGEIPPEIAAAQQAADEPADKRGRIRGQGRRFATPEKDAIEGRGMRVAADVHGGGLDG